VSFLFASESGDIPLAAEPLGHIFGLAFTNSMLFGLVMAALVLTLFARAAKKSTLKPTNKLTFAIESLVEYVLQIGEDNFGSRKKAVKHMPLLLTLFTFILFSNLSGLIPGVGTIVVHNGEESVPLFRAFTTDLNSTLALAILTIGTVQFYAIKELGIFRHIKHYFSVAEPWYSPINFFMGPIEIMSEFIRIMTLSMRLFGVIYAGEVLLHVIGNLAGNFGWAATFPIYLLEIFFSSIQAYLFMMLSLVYMANATHDPHAEEHEENVRPVKEFADVATSK
jgi:F-type H+-transporting ATPase subunit a